MLQKQGFMQDKIIATHTCFGGHMDVNCYAKPLNVSDDLKWTINTCDTIFTHFQGITNNIYGFGRPLFCSFIFYPSTTRPPYFYPSILVFTHPIDGWTGLYIIYRSLASSWNHTQVAIVRHSTGETKYRWDKVQVRQSTWETKYRGDIV